VPVAKIVLQALFDRLELPGWKIKLDQIQHFKKNPADGGTF
jgi:hypothetical protein